MNVKKAWQLGLGLLFVAQSSYVFAGEQIVGVDCRDIGHFGRNNSAIRQNAEHAVIELSGYQASEAAQQLGINDNHTHRLSLEVPKRACLISQKVPGVAGCNYFSDESVSLIVKASNLDGDILGEVAIHSISGGISKISKTEVIDPSLEAIESNGMQVSFTVSAWNGLSIHWQQDYTYQQGAGCRVETSSVTL